jgi:hypothetical protein
VVPGTLSIENTVGPAGVRTSIVRFVPSVELPSDATIRAYLAGFRDFAGNAVSTGPQILTTESGTLRTFGKVESFTSTTQRDDALSNAYWGTKVSGRLTGLIVGSTKDPQSSLTVSAGTTTLSGSEYHWKNLVVEAGAVLRFNTTSAVQLYVSDSVVVEGAIDVSGEDGDDNAPFYAYNRSLFTYELEYAGGAGGPNGGDGGDCVAVVPTSSGSYRASKTYGGAGPGGGGAGVTKTDTYRGYAGAGGSYATSGTKGLGYTSTAYGYDGTPGSTYGSSDLSSSGMRGGSGGGAGSGGIYHYQSTSYKYYRIAYGAGGGGGGGSIKIEATNDIVVRGLIDASGGRGGWGVYYGGSGGGGSGGDIWLRAGGRVVREGILDAGGGDGGIQRYYRSSSYPQYGGDGGDGRIMIEEPSNTRTSITARGLLSSGKLANFRTGGSVDFRPTKDTTLTTNSSNGGIFRYDEVYIPSGVTVTIDGDRAGQIIAGDDITVLGAIVSDGGAGENGVYQSSSGYTSVSGGSAGAGAGRGGRSHTVTGQVKKLEVAEDGVGPGAGEGGSPGYGYYGYTYTYTYTTVYYYYPGAGGGAGYGRPGEDGLSNWLYSYSYYSYLSSNVPPYRGVPGTGGAPYALYDGSGDLRGGSGGGGGANAFYINGSSGTTYYYQAGSGGGGGGAVLLETPGKLTVSGRIDALGGQGGNGYSSSQGAGGGGGSGGAIVLRADSFSLTGALDTSGGHYGINYTSTSTSYHYSYYYGHGGEGAAGHVRLESTNDLAITNGSGGMRYGSFLYRFLEAADRGVTVWFDSGALNPDYDESAFLVTQSDANVFLEVAHTRPDQDAIDETTAVKLTPAEVAAGKADGYRFFRFYMTINSASSYVDEVRVEGSYRAK